MDTRKVYAVALAGGQGAKLWPLSRKRRPKELLHCGHGRSLLEQTITRVSSLISLENRWIITTEDQADAIEPAVSALTSKIIIEPDGRDTAAAMIHAALLLREHDKEAVVVFLPTDHYIPQTSKFLDFLSHAIDFAAKHSRITFLGLPASYPATEYGYIAYDSNSLQYPTPVTFFHEKPSSSLCAEYVTQGLLWNSGIVVSQVDLFIEQCKEVAPDIFEGVHAYLYENGDYYGIQRLSAQKAFFEKITQSSVLPSDFLWSDVGMLEKFLSVRSHSVDRSQVISIDAVDNLVDAQESLVALVGVDNLCVVQSDDVLLIVNRDHVDKIKSVLEVLKQEYNEEYL
jgi:mannose-1-phosphate guanylyltransferase